MKRKTEKTRLFEATLSGDLELVKAAIAAGDQIDTRDRDGRTCLFQAVLEGNKAVADVLIENGSDVNAQDNDGETPLHFAAREHHLEIANALLRKGSVVDARDSHGNTPLARAVFASKGRGDMIKLLLASGADKESTNNYGMSPLDLAKSIGNYDVAQFIR